MAETKTRQSILDIVVNNDKALASLQKYQKELAESTARTRELKEAKKEEGDESGELQRQINAEMEVQKALKKEMREISYQIQKNIQQNTEQEGSLVSLRGQLSQLTRQYDELSEADRTGDIGKGLQKNIMEVQKKLTEAEQSTGRFQRNVGNYSKSFQDAFSAMGGSASGVINPIKNVTSGLKVMSQTPVIAILGLLASIIGKVIESLKSSEESINSVSVAMAPLNAIGNIVSKMFQGLGSIVAKVAEFFGALLEKLGLVSDEMKAAQEITKQEIELRKMQREATKADADASLEIAKLKSDAADKERFTAQERLEFLRQAGEKEKEIAQRALEDARLQYEIIKAKNALTKSSAEELQKEADAYAAMVAAETAYYNKTKEINKQVSSLQKEQRSQAEAAVTARINAEKSLIQQELSVARKGSEEQLSLQRQLLAKEYEAQVASTKSKVKDAAARNRTLLLLEQKYRNDLEKLQREHDAEMLALETQVLTNRMNALEEGSREYLAAAVALRQHELDTLARMQDESDAAFESRRLAAVKALNDAQRRLIDDATESARLALENKMNELGQTGIEKARAEIELRKYELESLTRQVGESDEAFYARQLAARKAYNDAQRALMDAETADRLRQLENEMNAQHEGTLERIAAEIEMKKFELDSLHQLEEESDADFKARMLAAQKAYVEAKKSYADAEMAIEENKAKVMTSLMEGIINIMDATGTENKGMVALSKTLALAQIAIETGIATAKGISQAQSVPYPANLAAIASTIATIMSGITSAIKSVKSAKFAEGGLVVGPGSGKSDSIPARVSNGESVINARSTSMFAPLLSAINEMGGGASIPSPSGGENGIAMLAQAVAVGMRAADIKVSVEEINQVSERVDTIRAIAVQ